MKRSVAFAVLIMLVGALTAGCGGDRRIARMEATYKRTKADLFRQIDTLPPTSLYGATLKTYIESSLDGGQGNVNINATMPATATVAQMNALADTLERTVWLSHLDPLGRISLGVSRVGRPPFEVERLWQDDTEPLRAKYGPRPDGLQ